VSWKKFRMVPFVADAAHCHLMRATAQERARQVRDPVGELTTIGSTRCCDNAFLGIAPKLLKSRAAADVRLHVIRLERDCLIEARDSLAETSHVPQRRALLRVAFRRRLLSERGARASSSRPSARSAAAPDIKVRPCRGSTERPLSWPAMRIIGYGFG
jgi:hypothetical protein